MEWNIGANWKHPQGPESDIKGKDNYPVVHIAFEDARRIAIGLEEDFLRKQNGNGQPKVVWKKPGFPGAIMQMNYPAHANRWEGEFPTENTEWMGMRIRHL